MLRGEKRKSFFRTFPVVNAPLECEGVVLHHWPPVLGRHSGEPCFKFHLKKKKQMKGVSKKINQKRRKGKSWITQTERLKRRREKEAGYGHGGRKEFKGS